MDEEALERARQGLPMDQVFPELSMSEDERIRKDIIHFILYKVGNRLDEETEHKFITWLEKQKEQKPLSTEETEWNSIAFLEQLGYTCIPPGAEQKPAEWSEEDEKTRSNLMSLLANMRGNRITEETYQKYYPWLKALRPSWKPSDEQIRPLEYAIDYFKKKKNDTTYLESLLNDPQKLM